MTHPDIKNVEKYGYTYSELKYYKPLGVCAFCGSDVFSDGEVHVKSFDGVFCNSECCNNYYEIATIDY